MIKLDRFPLNLQSQIKEIKKLLHPYTQRAYFVGGCVRDAYLNISQENIFDIDIEVYDIPPKDFDELMKKLGAQGVGKSFFVYKYKDIDLALPRIERKVGVGHKAFEVAIAKDEQEASKRRDFTMNSLMLNIFDNTLVDCWDGLKAIKKKELKLIDEDSFKEDSLRVLRAVQFAARFELNIEENTLKVMKSISLKDLSKTRVFWELEKFFNAEFLLRGVKYFYELDLYEKIFSLHVNFEQQKKIEQEIQNATFLEHLRAYYFVYIVSSVLQIEPKEMLRSIEVPNNYLRLFKYQPFSKVNVSDKELFVIAMKIALKEWLGTYKGNLVKRAKELKIFDEVYSGGVDIQDVIKDGFEKENIKKEYERRVLATIEDRCK